jgi:hypothetical protein
MIAISRAILVFDKKQPMSGSGFLLGPHLAVTAAHVVQSGPPHIRVLASNNIERLEPGQFDERSVPAITVTRLSADIALLEFDEAFPISKPSRIVITQPGQRRNLIVRVKGYASVLSEVDPAHSLFVPISGEARLVADDMHGGGAGAFTLPLKLFTDPTGYQGMSGAVLTYLDEPLAIQHQAWPGLPAKPEFRRLDILFHEASGILESHGIGKLPLPDEEPQLFIVEDQDLFEANALPVPIVAVEGELIDSVRTHDFTSPVADPGIFRLPPLDLDGLATGQLEHVLIEAPAGFGKTFLLRRTAAHLSQDRHTFFVTCSRIPTFVLENNVKASELLEQVIAEAISPDAAQRFAESGSRQLPRFLVLDALNEIGARPDAIRRLLHQARMAAGVTVLASQRPAITRAPPEGYTLGFLLPLDRKFVVKILGSMDPGLLRLLRIPLFFELKEKKGIQARTQVDAIRDYFVRCLGGLPQFADLNQLTPQYQAQKLAAALHAIGEAATEVYRQKQSTAVSEQFFSSNNLFSEIGGISQALAAGFVVKDGDLVRFRHQLFHDWAVARFYFDEKLILSSRQPRTDLNVATLSRQSTDTLEFLVQMHALESPRDAETVVLKIYDWDYPAADTSLVSWVKVAQPDGPLPQPPRHLEIATFSLIAEKGFDLFDHTVRRFDSIRSSVEPVLERLLQLHRGQYQLTDLVAAVREGELGPDVPEWYRLWIRAFCQEMQFEDLLTLLQSDDGALGWTASNVLARSPVDDTHTQDIVALFNSVSSGGDGSPDRATTIRWRLVHAVGRSGWAVGFLARTAGDVGVEADVRYGAVRSLFSIALTSEVAASTAIDAVLSLDRQHLLRDPRVASVIFLCPVPAPGIAPPALEHWVGSFEEMLGRHRDELEPNDPDGASMWARRMEELQAWKQSMSRQ